jgi:very-short-patch-repair endonuclease
VHPVEALERLGGVSDATTLLRLTSRKRVARTVRTGEVLRVGHRQYALPTASDGLKAAARLSGTASHASAASIHGWRLASQPERPAVIVPRNRKVSTERRHGVDLRWRDLDPEEVDGAVTSPYRTVLDCARDLELPDALAIADSALRHRDIDQERLIELALALPTTGKAEALKVAEAASPLAANPFESALRGISLDVPDLNLRPQLWIEERGFRGRPDLVDRRRRLVVEADSFEFHSTRTALRRDCERYNALVVRGWTVLRFAWKHVMFERDYVRDCLIAVAEGPSGRAALPPTLLWTA